ncbi:MAG: molybdopterin-binding protein [Candidatus Bathyarchaeota archaeon]|nr:molybdopterin-binding protein [Candidatus Bathyarchaeota archaeon]
MTVGIEVVCIGNELLIGKIVNTNAYWLARQATLLGADVRRITVIPDAVEEIASCIREAMARKPQFIVTTGGLGPTFDDKTLQGLAVAFNRKLEVNQKALAMVKQRCFEYVKSRQMPTEIQLTPPRVKMATLPQDAEPINNPIGTAPGVRIDMAGTVLFALPGVPSEMEAIFNEAIEPLLKKAVGDYVFCERSIFVDNMVESRLAPLIDQVMHDNPGVYAKSHPMHSEGKPHIELHLTIRANSEQEPANKLKKALEEFTRLIEEHDGKVYPAF